MCDENLSDRVCFSRNLILIFWCLSEIWMILKFQNNLIHVKWHVCKKMKLTEIGKGFKKPVR